MWALTKCHGVRTCEVRKITSLARQTHFVSCWLENNFLEERSVRTKAGKTTGRLALLDAVIRQYEFVPVLDCRHEELAMLFFHLARFARIQVSPQHEELQEIRPDFFLRNC